MYTIYTCRAEVPVPHLRPSYQSPGLRSTEQLRYTRWSTRTISGIERDKTYTYYHYKIKYMPCRCFCRKPQRVPTFWASAVANRQLLGGKLTSDKGLFSPMRANKERRMGNILECTGRWTVGCWLARQLERLKASTAMDHGTETFLISA